MTSIDLRDAPYSVPIQNTVNLFGEEYCINLLDLYPWVSQVARIFLFFILSRFLPHFAVKMVIHVMDTLMIGCTLKIQPT